MFAVDAALDLTGKFMFTIKPNSQSKHRLQTVPTCRNTAQGAVFYDWKWATLGQITSLETDRWVGKYNQKHLQVYNII